MARPGTEILSRAAPPVRGAPSDTGVWYVAGLAERGQTNEAIEIRNMDEYGRRFGARVSYGTLYDALDVFFREGGVRAYVRRVVGPGADVDTVTLNAVDGTTPAIAVDSNGEGATGFSVEIVAGREAGEYVIVVSVDGIELERSPSLADNTAAVNWSENSPYVRVRSLGADDPDVQGPTALDGGDDDRAAVTDTEREAALADFPITLGPGQVSFPGATTTTMHTALLDHARDTRRVALLDAPDSGSRSTLEGAAAAIRALVTDSRERGSLFAPWTINPGVVRGTTRTVPPSATVAGLIARSDARTDNPNTPAAGANGEARFMLGLTQPAWSDNDREAINEAGVNLFRNVYGGLRLYGYRTVVDTRDPAWLSLAAARIRMAIENQADGIAEEFVFDQIDGRGRKVAEFNGALSGMLQGYWLLGALFGDTADEAFVVDTGPTVNTPETLANQELRAVIGLRTSPFAELVRIEIVKVPITEAL